MTKSHVLVLVLVLSFSVTGCNVTLDLGNGPMLGASPPAPAAPTGIATAPLTPPTTSGTLPGATIAKLGGT